MDNGDHHDTASLRFHQSATTLRSDDRKVVRSIERDPWNRLRSVVEDSKWVMNVAHSMPHLPVIGNLRCGAWYLSPHLPETSRENTYCYFKSTDGHANEWSFSLKRPNLDVAHLVQRRGGVVIVDSTRRGKSLPDALSKTIPIWCAVLTEASHRKYGTPPAHLMCKPITRVSADPFRWATSGEQSSLVTPAHQVPPSEHQQIQKKIEGWVRALLNSDHSIPQLSLPLVPMFLTPPTEPDPPAANQVSVVDDMLTRLQKYSVTATTDHPIIVLSASRRVDLPTPDPTGTYYYVQGSGDDEELWSLGLSPDVFWSREHHANLMSSTREELPQVILQVVQTAKTAPVDQLRLDSEKSVVWDEIAIGATGLFCGRRPIRHIFSDREKAEYSLIIHCDAEKPSPQAIGDEQSSPTDARILREAIPQGKKGLRTLRVRLPHILDVVQIAILNNGCVIQNVKILVVDSTRQDLCLCVLVAILARFYDSHTQMRLVSGAEIIQQQEQLSKADVRKRLHLLVRFMPEANPSRSHLLRVNEVLLRRGDEEGERRISELKGPSSVEATQQSSEAVGSLARVASTSPSLIIP